MPLKNIRQVRRDLKVWGLFWSDAEMGQGYARQSVTARICETLRTEIQISSTLYLFSYHADSIYVPPYIQEIGNAVDKLASNCKAAIHDKYIKHKKRDDFYLREAENALIALL